jgi:hypothetical protein
MDIVFGGGTGGVSRKTPYLVNRPPCRTGLRLGGAPEILQLELLGNPAAALISLWTMQRVL